MAAVCVAAAPAVNTIAVNGAFASKVGMGAEAGPSVGRHASIKPIAANREIVLCLRQNMGKLFYFTTIDRYA